MWKTITKPFAWLMIWLYNLTGSYGWAIILFALAVNLILTPFMAKSKKSMMRSTRLQPKIQELQRRHEGNQQKLNAEMQKLYREEGVNPMSGCLWSLIPFPILIALYSVIRMPMTRMMSVSSDFVTTLQNFFVEKGLYTIPERTDAYAEIKLTKLAHENWDLVQSGLAGKIDPHFLDIDFSFLGLNLGDQPNWKFFSSTDWSDVHVWLPALGLFLIPFISAGLSWLSMKISTATNPPAAQDSQAAATAKSMNLMMPLMSIWICFIMPAAMGIYWIANSIFGVVRDYILTKIFKSSSTLRTLNGRLPAMPASGRLSGSTRKPSACARKERPRKTPIPAKRKFRPARSRRVTNGRQPWNARSARQDGSVSA